MSSQAARDGNARSTTAEASSPPNVAIDHLFPPYTMEKVDALRLWFDY